MRYPTLIQRWHDSSNNIVIVGVPNEAALLGLETTALALGLKHHLIIEPDIGDEATALAFEPGEFAKRMCASYPSALKGVSAVAA